MLGPASGTAEPLPAIPSAHEAVLQLSSAALWVKAEHNGITKLFEADTVVLAVGMHPNQELSKELAGKVQALYSIGDCVEPRKIVGAIRDGAQIACEL